MLAHDTGLLAATTALGKTVVAAWLIAQRGVNTLVLVHRRQLSAQSFEQVACQAKAKFVTGLSATVRRKDGHQALREGRFPSC